MPSGKRFFNTQGARGNDKDSSESIEPVFSREYIEILYDKLLEFDLTYNQLYDMTLYELENTLECRKKGLAYSIWKTGMLSQMLEKYPDSPEKASPELYPPKKTIKMEEWMIKKYLK